jgi:hypothetical protein
MSGEDILNINRKINELKSQIQLLESRSRQTWSYPPSVNLSSITYLGIIRSGNLIVTVGTTNFYGLKYPSANVTAVPTTVAPTGNGACPDGLTAAYIESETGVQTAVWIGWRLQPGGTGIVYNDMVGVSIPAGASILCRTKISMPVTAGGVVDVYVPYRVL